MRLSASLSPEAQSRSAVSMSVAFGGTTAFIAIPVSSSAQRLSLARIDEYAARPASDASQFFVFSVASAPVPQAYPDWVPRQVRRRTALETMRQTIGRIT